MADEKAKLIEAAISQIEKDYGIAIAGSPQYRQFLSRYEALFDLSKRNTGSELNASASVRFHHIEFQLPSLLVHRRKGYIPGYPFRRCISRRWSYTR